MTKPKKADKKGQNNGNASLMTEDVREIRRLAVFTKHLDLAKRYNVTPGAISKIVHRQRWTHVQ